MIKIFTISHTKQNVPSSEFTRRENNDLTTVGVARWSSPSAKYNHWCFFPALELQLRAHGSCCLRSGNGELFICPSDSRILCEYGFLNMYCTLVALQAPLQSQAPTELGLYKQHEAVSWNILLPWLFAPSRDAKKKKKMRDGNFQELLSVFRHTLADIFQTPASYNILKTKPCNSNLSAYSLPPLLFMEIALLKWVAPPKLHTLKYLHKWRLLN